MTEAKLPAWPPQSDEAKIRAILGFVQQLSKDRVGDAIALLVSSAHALADATNREMGRKETGAETLHRLIDKIEKERPFWTKGGVL